MMRCSTCMGLLISGQLSHASPTPSLSRSVCIGFGTLGQLSSTFWIPAKHPHSSHTQRWWCRTQIKILLSNWTVFTVSIDVFITSISLSVIVSVLLVDVGNGGTVITCITERSVSEFCWSLLETNRQLSWKKIYQYLYSIIAFIHMN